MSDKIAKELDQIRQEHGGQLDPKDVVAFAKRHKNSALYTQFNWNVEEAAQSYWLETARRIIRVHIKIVDVGGRKEPIRAYVSLIGGDNYQPIQKVLARQDTRKQLIATQLSRLWSAYKSYPLPELDGIRDAIIECQNAHGVELDQAAE